MKYLKHNKIIRNTISIVLAYLATLAFSYILKLGKNEGDLFSMLDYGYDWLTMVFFVLGSVTISRFVILENKRTIVFSFVGGMLLSLSSVWGAYALFVNDIFLSGEVFFLQLMLMIGLNFVMTPAVAEIFALLKKYEEWYDKKSESKVFNKKNNLIYFLIVWGIIFICYLPIFLAYWPGNFVFDASYQMNEVINNAYKTHHPLLHTWLMGTAYNIGLEMGNVSQGFQLYTLLQMLVLSSSFAYCILYLRKKGVPLLVRILSVLWFALFPMNSIFAISATKDVLFAAFFLYTMIFFCRYFFDKEKFRWHTYIPMILFAVLSAMFRNNAIYAIVVFGIIGLVVIKGIVEKGKVVLIILSVYLLTTLGNQLLIDGLNAYPGAKNRESLSVPLQGLARVASYRGDELYEYLYNEICMYIRAEDIKGYNPFLSDPIKNEANEELLETNKSNFFKLWCKVGIEFPDEYVESLVANTMGYWYLLPMKDYVSMKVSLYHTLIGTGEEIEKVCYCDWGKEMYNDLFYKGTYKYVPILGYSFRIAPYMWFIVFVALWSILRKDKKAIC